ncbi:MAG: ABC transporter ATP-binding protein [Pseudomonadota bacterium]
MNKNILELKSIERSYMQGQEKLAVLRGIDLKINSGEIIALVGASGSGKSTLLQIAGLLDNPSSGEVIIDGVNAAKSDDKTRTALRLKYLGFVYQFHNLLPDFSAAENIAIPQIIAGKNYNSAVKYAEELLHILGLKKRSKHLPSELSGGEQQRVAIARALANNPALILADEPTGNLDPETSEKVFQLFIEIARSKGLAAIIATHNITLANRMDRKLVLNNGRI